MSPEDQNRVFGVDKLKTAYQRKKHSLKSNLRLKSVHVIKKSEEKDCLKSIKVYKFNNTKENWHEFALKFRVIADNRGFYGVIDGSILPPDEQGKNSTTPQDKKDALSAQKAKLKARAANNTGYRDIVMPVEGISLNIVENGISEELTKGDLKKTWERLERRWTLHEIPQLQARKHKAETYGLDNLHGKEAN